MTLFNPRRALRRALGPAIERGLDALGRAAATPRAARALPGGYLGEIRAVLAGRVMHQANRDGKEATHYHLRRAIHRLEKGLSMPGRRAVFGLDYIEETAAAYAAAARGGVDAEELRWAHDVMAAYFDAVGEDPAIARAEAAFRAAPPPPAGPAPALHPWPGDGPRLPFPRPAPGAPPVGPGALAALARRRRSVRWFRPDPPPRAQIDAALDIARLSPSACNRQPLQFRVFDSPARAQRIAALAGGAGGFTEGMPCIVALVGRMRAYPHARDRRLIYVDGGLAAMSFMYALETVGLASCPINWPDVPKQERRMRAEIGLAPDERVVMLIAVGLPLEGGMIPSSAKVSMDLWRSYDGPDPAAAGGADGAAGAGTGSGSAPASGPAPASGSAPASAPDPASGPDAAPAPGGPARA
ncbi:nitroreductase family protein [Rhodovulum sp. DZ06]|uniref:nitroreductase family protein n=1 Tax=Rhodovulum sp. DZ06 TaxID=3425126 RepID=UPI003D34B75E